jgi:hypothetical protein
MKWLAVLLVACVSSVLFSASSYAETAPQLLITEIRLGGTTTTAVQGGSLKQFVALHNPGKTAIDMSNWRLQYAKVSYSGDCNALTWSDGITLNSVIEGGSTEYIDISFPLTDNAAGSLRVMDQNDIVYDAVGWGDGAPCYETQIATPTPKNDKSLVRYSGCDGTFDGVDTNNNSRDFISNQTPLSKAIAPDCTPVCLDDQQLIDQKCVDDQCITIDGFQAAVPTGYAAIDRECKELLPLVITEILPNVAGSDTGKEFIELFNPADQAINLKWYRLMINGKVTSFPDGAVIAAGSYASFSDVDLGVSLLNTSVSLQILSVNDVLIGDQVTYRDPGDDMAWASVDGVWQYTSQPTPGAVNQPSPYVVDDDETEARTCSQNQYRSPETGRCRRVAVQAGLATCKEGQSRSEGTGRCRKNVTATVVKPCKNGQYRSEETNRCRSIATDAKTLTPCKDGQERNPDTNRCRNVAVAMDTAGFKTEPVADTGKAFIGWWALGGAGVLALGRIGWEWRSEMLSAVQKISSFFTSGK